MRPLALALSLVVFASCSNTKGPEGPPGPAGNDGPSGAMGAPGPQGPQGPQGIQGEQGAQGNAGAQGTMGAQGPQGLQGQPGMVLVLDGGAVIGPPGPGVQVDALAVGNASCAYGGVQVGQISDGGITYVCNGAPGATGMTGPQGAQGPMGAQGPQGMTGPQGSAGAQGAQGPQGNTGSTGAQGAQGPAGSNGSIGPQGPQGPAGSAGAIGPQGPQGIPGAVLYLDGGVVLIDPSAPRFAGFTTFTSTGNIGGRISTHAYCAAEFPGSHFCTDYEFKESNPSVALSGSGAWIDFTGSDNLRATYGGCNNWSYGLSAISYGMGVALPTGFSSNSPSGFTCASVMPLACCYGFAKVKFRGFTAFTTSGNIGGRIETHARCQAEFPGSHFCTDFEFKESDPSVALSGSGAWIDFTGSDDKRATYGGCNNWSYGLSAISYGMGIALPTGFSSNSPSGFTCASVLPLACCQ